MRVGLNLAHFVAPGGSTELGANLTRVAQRAEAAGFESLWVWDHLLWGRARPFPRPPPPARPHAPRPQTHPPPTPADPDRRQRRAEDAPSRRPARRRVQPDRPPHPRRARPQAGGAPPSLRAARAPL